MERFGLSTALPATPIIDQEGRIAFRMVGDVKRRQAVTRLNYLLSGRPGWATRLFVNSMPELPLMVKMAGTSTTNARAPVTVESGSRVFPWCFIDRFDLERAAP